MKKVSVFVLCVLIICMVFIGGFRMRLDLCKIYKTDGYKHGEEIMEISYEQEEKINVIFSLINNVEKDYRDYNNHVEAEKEGEPPDYILELIHVTEDYKTLMYIYG